MSFYIAKALQMPFDAAIEKVTAALGRRVSLRSECVRRPA